MKEYDDHVWNRFVDFVFPQERNLTREQVQAELREQGIDISPSITRLASILKQARESRRLAQHLSVQGRNALH